MFDWLLYTNDLLIEKYLSNKKLDNKYIINENLMLVYKEDEKYLIKKSNEYKIKLDFINKLSTIELLNEGLKFDVELLDVELKEEQNKKFINYRLDDDLNRLIINEKEE